jgi:hypothetical protein
MESQDCIMNKNMLYSLIDGNEGDYECSYHCLNLFDDT